MSSWYVAQTHVNSEGKARVNLLQQGFTAYLPQYAKRRRHARRVETVKVPLFPRYIFIAADTALHRWRSIGGTLGISSLVRFGNDPAMLSGSIVEAIKSREECGLVVLAKRCFEPGDKIRIREGHFCESLGLVEEMRDAERVCVLLDLLGRKVRVTLDALALELD